MTTPCANGIPRGSTLLKTNLTGTALISAYLHHISYCFGMSMTVEMVSIELCIRLH